QPQRVRERGRLERARSSVTTPNPPRGCGPGAVIGADRVYKGGISGTARSQRLQRCTYFPGVTGAGEVMVLRGGNETRNNQLPHAQAGEGRPVLREDLRSAEGLRVLLR